MPHPRFSLPFSRGTTFYDGATPDSSADHTHLVGQTFVTVDRDTDEARAHSDGTGLPVKLRCVKASAAISNVAGKALAFGTDSKDLYRIVDALVATAGHYGLPADPAFALTDDIQANDLLFVVEEGPCEVLLAGTVAVGDLVTTNASGHFVKYSGSGVAIGVADEAGVSTDRVRVLIGDKYVADRQVYSVAFTVGAEATNAVTVSMQFKDKFGRDLTGKVAVKAWLSDGSDANDVLATSGTLSVAAGTDGAIVEYSTDNGFLLITEDDGDMDLVVTETNGAQTYFVNVVLPNGNVATSGVLTFA